MREWASGHLSKLLKLAKKRCVCRRIIILLEEHYHLQYNYEAISICQCEMAMLWSKLHNFQQKKNKRLWDGRSVCLVKRAGIIGGTPKAFIFTEMRIWIHFMDVLIYILVEHDDVNIYENCFFVDHSLDFCLCTVLANFYQTRTIDVACFWIYGCMCEMGLLLNQPQFVKWISMNWMN